MVDSCSNIQTGEQFARLLRHNFNRHFSTNRAPLGLHFHASWLKSKKEFKEELIKFIEEMLDRNDVYFVTMLQVTIVSPLFSVIKEGKSGSRPLMAEVG